MKKIIITLIILILGAAVYWLVSANRNTKEVSEPANNTATVPTVPTENKNVTIQNFAFSPAVLEIKTGVTVVWKHNDSAPHTVTANTSLFESGRLNKGDLYSFKFTEPGEYNYHCGIHPSMTARVIVK